jgi:acetate kinase
MKILVINSGSSSIKYKLFEMTSKSLLAQGTVERIGESKGKIAHEIFSNKMGEQSFVETNSIPDHTDGLTRIGEYLMNKAYGVIQSPNEIMAVGHRVVHGGEQFSQTMLITNEVKSKIRELCFLAPLHNPANLLGIEVAEKVFPDAKQVAVFDTAFHQTMPDFAYRYAIPQKLYDNQQIRSYGMHGTSHLYVSKKATKYLGKNSIDTNLITIHLGNGCSISAIKGGKSVDTSMGLSPLPGLMMGTRSGDIDPAIIFFLHKNLQMPVEKIDNLLNKDSGLKGIAQENDMRMIEKRFEEGDENAKLALEMYCYRIKKYIGSYLAVLGKTDAIIFTAGVGQNS